MVELVSPQVVVQLKPTIDGCSNATSGGQICHLRQNGCQKSNLNIMGLVLLQHRPHFRISPPSPLLSHLHQWRLHSLPWQNPNSSVWFIKKIKENCSYFSLPLHFLLCSQTSARSRVHGASRRSRLSAPPVTL